MSRLCALNELRSAARSVSAPVVLATLGPAMTMAAGLLISTSPAARIRRSRRGEGARKSQLLRRRCEQQTSGIRGEARHRGFGIRRNLREERRRSVVVGPGNACAPRRRKLLPCAQQCVLAAGVRGIETVAGDEARLVGWTMASPGVPDFEGAARERAGQQHPYRAGSSV